jgi:hypothetical protein
MYLGGAGVAEVDGQVHGAARLHALRPHVQRDELDESLGQQLAHHLTHTPEARDDDMARQIAHLVVRRLKQEKHINLPPVNSTSQFLSSQSVFHSLVEIPA